MDKLTARLLDPETFEKRLDFFMKVQLWDTEKQELAAAIRELHARLRTAKAEGASEFTRGWNTAKAEITAALGCDWEGIYLAAKEPWALKVAQLVEAAKAKGAAETRRYEAALDLWVGCESELATAKADLAAAREDVARMDWLSRSSVATFTRVRQSECAGDMVEFFDGKSTYTGKTPRAALDSARAGSPR